MGAKVIAVDVAVGCTKSVSFINTVDVSYSVVVWAKKEKMR